MMLSTCCNAVPKGVVITEDMIDIPNKFAGNSIASMNTYYGVCSKCGNDVEYKENKMIKEQIRYILNAGGMQWLGFLLIASLFSMMTIGVIALSSDHKVRCYYLKTYTGSVGLVYKIVGDVDWSEDFTAFGGDDEDKVLAVFTTLKQCAPKGE